MYFSEDDLRQMREDGVTKSDVRSIINDYCDELDIPRDFGYSLFNVLGYNELYDGVRTGLEDMRYW